MTSDEIRGLVVVACTVLLIGVSIGSATAAPSASSESPAHQGLFVERLEDVQNESESQQEASLEQGARLGVQEGLAYLERMGVAVSDDHRNAALNGAIDAASTFEGRDDIDVPAAHMRQSAYGATIGALQRTELQSVAAVANPSERVIEPTATYEIVFGGIFGASVGAAQSKSSPGDVPPASVVNAAFGAASGSTQAVLQDPSVADRSGEATIGASLGALRGARAISTAQVPTQGPRVIIDPQPYVALSAEGSARGTLKAVGDRQRANQPPTEIETVRAADSSATVAVLRGTQNSWPPNQAYQFAYNTAVRSITSGQYAESGQ